MNPLQERANQLRAGLQIKAAEEKGYQQQHTQTVTAQLVEMFSNDFPELYQLLIQSQVSLEGEINQHGKKVVASSADKQLSIFYEGMKKEVNTWRFYGKDYKASSKESEQRLIMDVAEAFSIAQSKRVPGK